MFILISTVRKPIFHPNFKCFRNSTLKKKKAEHSRSRVRKRKLWKMFLRENEKKEICYVCNDRVPPFQLYSHSRRNRNVNPAYIFTRKRGFLPRILDNCEQRCLHIQYRWYPLVQPFPRWTRTTNKY